ncbi:RusA family crossover junction endodeoxyribonuclease [Dellaglioa sp. BT-FLS60]
MIELIILGDPVAQQRPKFNSRTKRAYDPKESKNYKRMAAGKARLMYRDELINYPIRVEIDVYRRNQKGTSKKQIDLRERKLVLPIVKPDATNYAKGIEDALTGIVWEDDNLIVESETKKYYSVNPRIEVRIIEINSENKNDGKMEKSNC